MRRKVWTALALVVLAFALPVRAEDSPGDAETTDSARKATDAVVEEAIASGAGSMEPPDGETQVRETEEERAERQFAENVWTSP